MAVEASIVVSFAAGVASDNVVVEFDPEWAANQDSDGNLKSTFEAGPPPDSPVFLLHYGSTLQVGSIAQTEGTVSEIGGPLTQSRSNDVTFTGKGETSGITYSNVQDSSVSVEWVGGLSGTVVVDATNLKLTSDGPCTGTATFDVTFQKQYMLTPPNPITLDDDGDYQITIFIFMIGA